MSGASGPRLHDQARASSPPSRCDMEVHMWSRREHDLSARPVGRRLSRRGFLAVAVPLSAVGLLAACGPQAPAQAPKPVDTPRVIDNAKPTAAPAAGATQAPAAKPAAEAPKPAAPAPAAQA